MRRVVHQEETLSMRDIQAMDIYGETLKYVRRIGMLYGDKYIPPYIASIGAHVGNLKNYGMVGGGMPFAVANERIMNIRVNIMMVAPAGFTKSMTLDTFLDGRTGLLKNAIPTKELGTITSAGLVGSVRQDGEEVMGLAEKYKMHIVGVEEFSSVSEMMKQSHSAPMLAEMLKIMDSGKVQKNIKGLDKEYSTQMTMWLGVQNALYDQKSGLTRRLVFIDATPDASDIRKYRLARMNGRGMEPNLSGIIDLRKMYREFYKGLKVDGHLKFTKDFDDYLLGLDILHSEDVLIEKVAMGYTLIRRYEGGDLVIDIDDDLKKMLDNIVRWRNDMSVTGNNTTILSILHSFPQGITQVRLEAMAMKLGMKRKEFRENLAMYLMEGLVEKERLQGKKGRPKLIIKAVPREDARVWDGGSQ